MKIILLFLSFFTLCIVSIQSTFALSGEIVKTRTLLQGQKEIKELKKQESVLQFKWSTFQLGKESLGEIMKPELTDLEKQDLGAIISVYLESKSLGEKKLNSAIDSDKDIQEIQKELISIKRDFYSKISQYIQEEKINAFNEYVDGDISFNSESKSIQSEIELKNKQQSERLEEIQDDIDDNNRNLRKQIGESIEQKYKPKLVAYIEQENFQSIPVENKIEIFTNISEKFQVAIDELEDKENPTGALDVRIISLETVVEMLDGYINTWKK